MIALWMVGFENLTKVSIYCFDDVVTKQTTLFLMFSKNQPKVFRENCFSFTFIFW